MNDQTMQADDYFAIIVWANEPSQLIRLYYWEYVPLLSTFLKSFIPKHNKVWNSFAKDLEFQNQLGFNPRIDQI